MKILVAVKQAISLDEDFEFRDDGREVDPDFFIRDLNEWDDFSLEEAVKIKEAAPTPVDVVLHPRRSVIDLEFAVLEREVGVVFKAIQKMAARMAVQTPPAS